MNCKQKMHFTHGEVNFFQTCKIPPEAKQLEIKDNFVIVGESETHGNDHRVAVLDKEKIKFYEKDGVLYMQNLCETEVYCPNEGRHDTITLPPSVWEIDKSQEYDYLEQELRSVRD